MASQYSDDELGDALHAVESMLSRLEQSKLNMEAKDTFRPGSSQQTLVDRRIAALKISAHLIRDEQYPPT